MQVKAIATGLAISLFMISCTEPSKVSSASAPTPQSARLIPQPDTETLDVAPESARVDLVMPTFTNPTDITNPLFPVSMQDSVLLVGRVDDKPFRTEVTLLPETRLIEWGGTTIEAAISQYAAFLDGRIEEVAFDYYAQADDGSVWYLGEEVSDFRNGTIVTTEGTWLAGRDGPGAMIMPAEPQPGDAFRTENSPGFAFEEVTVKGVDMTVPGPFGPVGGAIVVEELHMDGQSENKTFAPGYGEFVTSGAGDVEALALAIPTDSATGGVPKELADLERGAASIFDRAPSNRWRRMGVEVSEMQDRWEAYRSNPTPRRVEPRVTAALNALIHAMASRDSVQVREAAIEMARWTLDLQLPYRSQPDVDLERFELWTRQLITDAEAGDEGGVRGDVFTLDYIRDRIRNELAPVDLTQMNVHLGALQSAVADMEIGVIREGAQGLRKLVDRLLEA